MNDLLAELRLADALLRNDLAAFTHRCFKELYPGKHFEPTWHHDAVAYGLTRTAVAGDYPRLIINLPPRSLKSEIASIALPAFLLGRDPSKKVIVVSYNQDLAADLGRKSRQVMMSGGISGSSPPPVSSAGDERCRCISPQVEGGGPVG